MSVLPPPPQASMAEKPQVRQVGAGKVLIKHSVLGDMMMEVDVGPDGNLPPLLFTDNDTNHKLLYQGTNATPYVKDAFHNYIVNGSLHTRCVLDPSRSRDRYLTFYAQSTSKGSTVCCYTLCKGGVGVTGVAQLVERRTPEIQRPEVRTPSGAEERE